MELNFYPDPTGGKFSKSKIKNSLLDVQPIHFGMEDIAVIYKT